MGVVFEIPDIFFCGIFNFYAKNFFCFTTIHCENTMSRDLADRFLIAVIIFIDGLFFGLFFGFGLGG